MTVSRQYRGSTGESRRLERRARLISAAREVFGQRGFHASTVKAICDSAGLTERYFYESFENNEALFIAMHRSTSEHILKLIAAAANSAGSSAEEKVHAVLMAYYADIQRDPVSARLFAIDAGYISPAAREVCQGWRQSFGLVLEQAFGGPAAQGSSMVRTGVVVGLLGIGTEWMAAKFSTPLGTVVQAAEQIARALRPGVPDAHCALGTSRGA